MLRRKVPARFRIRGVPALLATFVLTALGVTGAGPGWVAAAAAALLLLPAPRAAPLGPGRASVLALGLALLASPIASWGERSRRPASPLVVGVFRPSRPGTAIEHTLRVDSLQIPDRRALKRLTGRRTDVGLDLSAFVAVPRDGTYRFHLGCDDRCVMSVANRTLTVHGERSWSLPLTEGVHELHLRYEQGKGPGRLRIEWERWEGWTMGPLEASLSGRPEARRGRMAIVTPFAVALVWWLSLSWLVLRAGESRRDWLGRSSSLWRAWAARPESKTETGMVQPRCWWWVAAGFATIAAVTWRLGPVLEEDARRLFEPNPRRQAFALERVEAYPWFLLAIGALSALVAAALFASRRWKKEDFSRRISGALLSAGILLALAWGGYVSQREWVRTSRPCYDMYCDYALSVREFLQAPSESTWSALREHLRENYRANSPVCPVLTALVGFAVPNIVTAFRLVCAAATLATALMVWRIGREHLDLGARGSALAVFLFVATGAVQRSMLLPQTDPVGMFFFTFAVERLLAYGAAPTLSRLAALELALAVALFTKLSLLPLMGAVPVAMALVSREGAVRGLLRGAAVIASPLALFGLFLVIAHTGERYQHELGEILAAVDRRLPGHVLSTVYTLLPLLFALLVTARLRIGKVEAAVLLIIAIYLAGLWTSHAPGWERYYLNVVPLGVLLGVARLSRVPAIGRGVEVACLALAFALAHALRMALGLYVV